jgi:hypothetical protein
VRLFRGTVYRVCFASGRDSGKGGGGRKGAMVDRLNIDFLGMVVY